MTRPWHGSRGWKYKAILGCFRIHSRCSHSFLGIKDTKLFRGRTILVNIYAIVSLYFKHQQEKILQSTLLSNTLEKTIGFIISFFYTV